MINSPLSDSGDSGVMSDYAPSPCSSTISEVAYSPACSTASSDVDDAFEELKTGKLYFTFLKLSNLAC